MLEHDAALFQCETCEIRTQRQELSACNLRALETFDLLARRIVRDFQLAPLVFDALRLTLPPTEALLLVEQLDLIYEAKVPSRRAQHGD